MMLSSTLALKPPISIALSYLEKNVFYEQFRNILDGCFVGHDP